MSFQRRLFLLITALMLLILLANFVVGVLNARKYFAAQMQTLSYDAATSLGFSLSTAARDKDQAQIESMVSAMFDSGYYLSIQYADNKGQLIASRARSVDVEGVPTWFTGKLKIPTPGGSAEVSSGWYRLGQVRVVSHPGYVYRDLWRICVEQFWIFVFGVVLAYGLVGIFIRGLLEPLARLESQVNAIAQENFVEESMVPSVPEFRRVVDSMNRMVRKIRFAFDQQLAITQSLRKEAYMDSLTELPNRAEFDARIAAWLSSDRGQGPAAMVLVQLGMLIQVNQKQGREAGDYLLEEMARTLKLHASEHPDMLIGRRSGTDFALFYPGAFPKEAKVLVQALLQELRALPCLSQCDSSTLCVGLAYSMTQQGPQRYLAAVDESLRANQQVSSEFQWSDLDDIESDYRSACEWLPIIESALDNNDLSIVFQPIFLNLSRQVVESSRPVFYEALCRLSESGNSVPAGVFWPLVERFGLSAKVDKCVVEQVLTAISEQQKTRISVNLSIYSLISLEFRNWLALRLAQLTELQRDNLIIEVPESLFRHIDTVLKPTIELIRQNRVQISIDRFGLMTSSMAYLQHFDFSFVKLDRRFVQELFTSVENRFYIRTLVGICNASDVILIAEGVEQEETLVALLDLGVMAYQGYLLGKPSSHFD